jgi:predicted ester cyclase
MGADGVALVRAAVDALNRGDIDGYSAHFAPGCVRWTLGGGVPVSPIEVAVVLRDLHRAFRGFHLHEELLLGCGSHVVARWRSTGVHEGEFAGMAPTGRSISVQTCEIYELDGDAVIATWSYGDPTDLVRQLQGGIE